MPVLLVMLSDIAEEKEFKLGGLLNAWKQHFPMKYLSDKLQMDLLWEAAEQRISMR